MIFVISKLKIFLSDLLDLKFPILGVLLLVLGISNARSAPNPQKDEGIKFKRLPSLAAVFEFAKKDHKLVFIDVYATWCGPCKIMDREIYTDPLIGKYYNDNYISIKIQMDSLKKDDEFIKSWYHEAANLNKNYKITALPTFLFFNSDGELIHREFGGKTKENFLKLGKFANNPTTSIISKLSAFRNGQLKDRDLLPIFYYAQSINNSGLKDSVAIAYFKYIKTQPINQQIDKETLRLFSQVPGFANSSLPIFSTSYNNPILIDSIIEKKGFAAKIVDYIITKEEIESKIGNPYISVLKDSDWNDIKRSIQTKYPKADANKIIQKYQLIYFQNTKNWPQFVQLIEKSLIEHPPTSKNSNDVFVRLNSSAWQIFLYCTDTIILKKAIQWSTLSYQLVQNNQYLDTKANLLYKLGDKESAIKLQEKAVEFDRQQAEKQGREFIYIDLKENLEKMKNGEKTWN